MRVPVVSPRAYERIALVSLVALGFIVVTGAAVRLTGSGLGCSTWPGCEQGQFIAPMELSPMIEQVNRFITGFVSVAVIVAVLGSLARRPRRRDLTWLSVGLVAGVVGQIVLGAYVVFFGLSPIMVTAHFLVSAVLLWNAIVLHHRAGEPEGPAVPIVAARIRALSRAALVLASLVLVTGTVVTGAGPHAGDEYAPRYGIAITSAARVHSVTMWAFLAVALVLLWQLTRDRAPVQVERAARRLVAAIVLQGALGYAQYFAGVPPFMVLFHVLGAVLVLTAALTLHLSTTTRADHRGPAGSPSPREQMVVS